jgi:hypothetical protein
MVSVEEVVEAHNESFCQIAHANPLTIALFKLRVLLSCLDREQFEILDAQALLTRRTA